MVEHDEVRVQAWVRATAENGEEKQRHTALHLSVVAVQSVACCVAVLLVMLLRVAGGDAYRSLKQEFYQALSRNEWVSAVAFAMDGNPLEQLNEEDVKEESFTDDESTLLTGTSAAVTALAPLESGTLTSHYGERVHPISGVQEFHTGVDIAAPMGTELLAAYDGKVIETGEDEQLGRYVRIAHNGNVEILYGHCDEVLASQGAVVKAGERVALVGSTGVSTGSHVHIRVSVDGNHCDPALLLPLEEYV